MTTPAPVTLVPAPGDVRLPNGTRCKWITEETIDALIDALASQGGTPEVLAPEGLGWALTRVLSHAEPRTDGDGVAWLLQMDPALLHAGGVTRVDLIARHHPEHGGWVVGLAVAD